MTRSKIGGIVHLTSLLLVALTSLGFQASSACDVHRIQHCTASLALDIVFTGKTDPDIFCNKTRDAVSCLDTETVDCPAQFTALVKQLKNISQSLDDSCQDPKQIDADFRTKCPFAAFITCHAHGDTSNTTDERHECLSLDGYEHCLGNFDTHCNIDFAKNLASLLFINVNFSKQKCHHDGYPTGPNTSLCDVKKIRNCAQQLAIEMISGDKSPNGFCRTSMAMMSCMNTETAYCPARFKPVVEKYKNISEALKRNCEISWKLDPDFYTKCPLEDLLECGAQPDSQAEDDEKQTCSYLGEYYQCREKFRAKCKNEFGNNLADFLDVHLDFTKQKCHDDGHETEITTSSVCDTKKIGECGKQIALEMLLDKSDVNGYCSKSMTAISCLEDHTAHCPARFKPFVEKVTNISKAVRDDCRSAWNIDQDFFTKCPFAKFIACGAHIVTADTKDERHDCSYIDGYYKCLETFKAGCTIDFGNNLASLLDADLDFLKQKCHDDGYKTVPLPNHDDKNTTGHHHPNGDLLGGAVSNQQLVIIPILASALVVSLRHLM